MHSINQKDLKQNREDSPIKKRNLLGDYLSRIEPGERSLNYIEKSKPKVLPEEQKKDKIKPDKKVKPDPGSLYTYIGIGAALGLAILIIFLILRKKKKKEKQDGNGHIPGRKWAK